MPDPGEINPPPFPKSDSRPGEPSAWHRLESYLLRPDRIP